MAVSREHDRVAELERENEALRRYIDEQIGDRQAVIERYERLLAQRDAETWRAKSSPTPTVEPDPAPDPDPDGGTLASLRASVTRVGARVASRLGLD